MSVLAVDSRHTNADLMLACRDLGYLNDGDLTLDATYGRGTWWSKWSPSRLVTSDLSAGTPMLRSDFTNLPFPRLAFDVVCYDPPYKLNGTPSGDVDARYGVGESVSWQDRMSLIFTGIGRCARVTRRNLLVKCQDQVCSGAVRWQTFEAVDHAGAFGLELVDMLFMVGGRAQPKGRRQVHARRNYSTLLVFKRK